MYVDKFDNDLKSRNGLYKMKDRIIITTAAATNLNITTIQKNTGVKTHANVNIMNNYHTVMIEKH